ncbi:MAG: M16 family metallopeptidase [Vicinamibacterales bacterium]
MASTLTAGLSPVRQTLANGATVIVQEAFATAAVSVNATFLAGSFDDPQELPGLAALTARVIDRGTAVRDADAIAEELDKRGVSLRIGTTRHAMTFSSTCLAEDFDAVLDLMVDIARSPVFPESELAKRRAECITFLRQNEDNPSIRAGEALSELLYGSAHPYGRPTRGTVATLERIDRNALVQFHARTIRPAVLTVVVVGDVGASRTIDRACELLETWSGAPKRPIVVPPPAVAAHRRLREIPMPGKSQTDIAYGFTTISRLDPRYPAYWLLNNILGQFGLGGRLADNIRERQGMAYYAFSAFNANVGESPLVVRAGVDPKNVDRTIEAIDAEVRDLGRHGPTAIEMDESRSYLIGSIPRLLETNDSIASFLQDCERFDLGLDYDRRLPEVLEAVTLDEVRAAAADVLHPERAAIAIAGPPTRAGSEP